MQTTWVSGGTATAPLVTEATSTWANASFKTFLAAMESWLDHAREHELIALAGLVNAECYRRRRQVQATDRQGYGQAA